MWNLVVQIMFGRQSGAYCKFSLPVCIFFEEEKRAIK